MPAQGIFTTMFFKDDVYGFSESHLYLNGAGGITPSAVADSFTLFKKRIALCGYGVQAVGMRLSQLGVFRDSKVFTASDLAALNPLAGNFSTNTGGTVPNDSDQPKACVLVRAESGALRRKPIYLAGVPDVIIRENPSGPAVIQIPAWLTLFNSYANTLVASWGFAAKQLSSVLGFGATPIIGLATQAGTALIGIVIGAGTITVDGTLPVQVRGVGRTNNAYPSLNGTWQVADVLTSTPVAGKTTVFLRGTSHITQSTITKLGTAQLADRTGFPYTAVQLIGQTTRKRGNRFLAPPGRRTVRRSI